MNSFLRKYSALSGFSSSQLAELFLFRPAIIGVPLPLFGASFNFFYTFHPIPCIGFEVFYKGKSIYFSADHFYHPEVLATLKEEKILNEKRYQQLINVKFDHTLILHEAGVPPIHTPQKVLAGLSEDVIFSLSQFSVYLTFRLININFIKNINNFFFLKTFFFIYVSYISFIEIAIIIMFF